MEERPWRVYFGSAEADDDFYGDVIALEVEENADLPGAMQLTLRVTTVGGDGDEEPTWVDDDELKPYARVAIVATPDGGSDACIFDGYVLSHRVHLESSTRAATLRVWGQDASCLMNVKDVVKPWTKTDGNIANEIFRSYGFATADDNTADDGPEHPDDTRPLMQRATDAQFLRDRARRNGKLFRVCAAGTPGQRTGYFVKPKLGGEPVATLMVNPPDSANVDAIDVEWDAARPTQVIANALLMTEDVVDGKTSDPGLAKLGTRTLQDLVTDDKHRIQARLTAAVDSATELRLRATSLLREASWFVTCEGETDLARLGHVLRVGTVVELGGAGTTHSGKYFVWSVRHSISPTEHRMRFVLMRNTVGGTA